jgi:Flp pilus assembly protein TadD
VALALAHRALERVEAWRAAAQKAIELNPRLVEAHVLLGDSYSMAPPYGCSRARDAALAERWFRRAIELDPRFGLASTNLAYLQAWNEQELEALATADGALAALPNDLSLMRARATALVWLSRPEEADRQLARIAGLTPTTVQDEWELAAVELLRGRAEDAEPRFRATLARSPLTLRAIDTARIYCDVGRQREAASYLDQVFAADPACATFVRQSPAFAACREDAAIRAALDNALGADVAITFESVAGLTPTDSYRDGSAVPAGARLSDQLQRTSGVSFRSTAEYVALLRLGVGHATGGFNGIGGVDRSHRLGYGQPLVITFSVPGSTAAPGVTDLVSVRGDNAPGSGSARMEAFGLDGAPIGSVTAHDSNPGLTLTLAVPGIHSLRLTQTRSDIAFDELRFHPPRAARGGPSAPSGPHE